MRKSNKLYTVNEWNKHLFDTGGQVNSFGDYFKQNNPFSGANIGGTLNGLAEAVGGTIGGLISNGYDSKAGKAFNTIGDIGGSIPVIGGFIKGAGKILGGISNALFGTKVDDAKLKSANAGTNYLRNYTSNATDFDDIEGIATQSAIENPYSSGLFVRGKARRKNNALREDRAAAQLFAENSLENNINNIAEDQTNNLLANYSAYGGPLGFSPGALGIMQNDKYIDAINNGTDAMAKAMGNSQTTTPFNMGARTFASGGSLGLNFASDFAEDPIGAAIRYNRSLEKQQAEQEALAIEAAKEAEYNDMKQRLANLETRNQGLEAMVNAQSSVLPSPELPVVETPEAVEPVDEAIVEEVTPNYALAKDFIRRQEGFSRDVYTDSNGMPTIGYGFNTYYPGTTNKVKPGDVITREEADKYLDAAIAERAEELSKKVPNWDNMNDNQRGALIDLSYNAGINARHFGKNSKLMKALAKGDYNEASNHLAAFSDNPAYAKALRNRSAQRRNLFMADPNTYAFGGELGTNGTDWTNGLLSIDAGGSHEENPLEGVQLGVDEQGIPNLVEEGETVYDDYVFSKRMKIPTFMYKELGLGGPTHKKDLTFAEASKILAKESEQRPNDPISQDGLKASLAKLAEIQETERMRKSAEEYTGLNTYACGGKKNKYPNGTENLVIGSTSYGDLMDFIDKEYPYMSTMERPVDIVQHPSTNPANWEIKPLVLPEAKIVGIDNTKPVTNTDNNSSKDGNYPYYQTWMRYAPVVGAGALMLTDALGLTNKPDYSYVKKLEGAADSASYAPNVTYDPIGDYLTYRPLDRMFYANQMGAQAGATRRAIQNNAGTNRGAAIASLIAADNNTQNALGNLYRQAEEYNDAKRERIADFNRRTNMFNSQMGLEAAMANARYRQQGLSAKLSGLAQAANLREAIDARTSAAKSANISNFLTSLGNIGRENMAFNMVNSTNAAHNGYVMDNRGVVDHNRKWKNRWKRGRKNNEN